MKKISKSDQPIEQQKIQQSKDLLLLEKLMTQPYAPTAPGEPCTIWIDGSKYRGHYTETGYEIDDL